jgi:hypothetical protein
MIATTQNMDNLGSHMQLVLYLGALFRSSFGGFANIKINIQTNVKANKKIDYTTFSS